MPVARLQRIVKRKPWGRRDIPPAFARAVPDDERVGEIWHQAGSRERPELLIKHLFTSDRLSIQVHPDDEGARRLGHPFGKDEAWVVLEAEAGARVGLGLRRAVSVSELRTAALDGTIEWLLDWRPAKAGDVFYLPAGTVHALGAGLLVVEVQQNVDLTFRLYDYGRPRELHLDEALAAALPEPLAGAEAPRSLGRGREILVSCPNFAIERWRGREGRVGGDGGGSVWLIPLTDHCSADGHLAEGEVFVCDDEALVRVGAEGELLVVYAGADIREFDGA